MVIGTRRRKARKSRHVRRNRKRGHARRRKNPGRHRVTLIHVRGGTWKRPKHSRLMRGKKIRVNRKRKAHRRKRNPYLVAHRVKYVRANPSRKARRSRRVRRNPKFNVKALMNKTLIMNAAGIGAGFIAGTLLSPALYHFIPATSSAKYGKYFGGIHLVLGAFMYTMSKNKNVKNVGVGLAASGIYDLVACNFRTLLLPALPHANAFLFKTPSQPAAGSYNISRAPVSAVARAGMHGSYQQGKAHQGFGTSYAHNLPTVGLSGTNPYSEIDW